MDRKTWIGMALPTHSGTETSLAKVSHLESALHLAGNSSTLQTEKV